MRPIHRYSVLALSVLRATVLLLAVNCYGQSQSGIIIQDSIYKVVLIDDDLITIEEVTKVGENTYKNDDILVIEGDVIEVIILPKKELLKFKNLA